MNRSILAVIAALSIAASAWAADPASGTATIVFSEGADLTIVRGPREIPLEDPVGEKLLPGDYVQTGRGGGVEIVTLPQKSVLRVAENTTFRFLGSGDGTEWGIELLYGRVRARAEGAGAYEIRTNGGSARAAGADFGMDIVVSRGAAGVQGKAEIYCFEGSVTVAPAKAQEAYGAVPVILSPGKSVSTRMEDGKLVMSAAELRSEKRDFWSRQDFRSEYAGLIDLPKTSSSIVAAAQAPQVPAAPVSAVPAVPAAVAAAPVAPLSASPSYPVAATPSPLVPAAQEPVEDPAKLSFVEDPAQAASAPAASASGATETSTEAPFSITAAPVAPPAPNIEWEKYKRQVMAKNVLIGTGSLIIAGGVGLQAWSAIRLRADQSDAEAMDILVGGVSTSAVGVVIGVIGLIANPRSPR